ncbi:50S ribosomal protein L10 [Helicobacter cappadocius]|uniref:Large ribosomal subunit protein uL10 n=1 Tax=Helicobacter cappadocius TaxID=3063998 RepID=A0AA90TEJ0_9HELI|nr:MULTISPECIES: 50S ribosomal protein L10 [unclassified Helicobacter]MDO7253775.1 50S ribosomal protein L10 [Helicobacter sp. faydin-H75]MDP2538655.1 50S ribosomal protein L10 [Helicobacter sp. faydin-H76]
MTKNEKTQMVEHLSSEFKNASALLVCDYKGLTVKSLEELRMSARKEQVKVQVIKNTLAKISMSNAGYPDLDLKDTNIFIWGNDQIGLSKLVAKFGEANKDKFAIKTGCFDGERVELDHIMAISKLPSRDELIGMLLSVWTAPARYFVTGLDNLKKQKEQE